MITKFLPDKRLFIGILLILFGFIISRAPLFLKLAFPNFAMDSYEYFYYLNLLKNNPDSIHKLFIELPVGYPLFCYIVGLFSDKIYTVVILQNIFNLSASLYLLYIVFKYFPKVTIWASVALTFSFIDSQSILWDNFILPDSIYKSTLLVLCGTLICVIKSENILPKIGLAFCMVLLALIRPNGIFIYAFIPVILFYFYLVKAKWQRYAYFILPLVVLNLCWSAYNQQVYGYFMFGNLNRIKHEFSAENDKPKLGTRQPKEIALRFNDYVFKSQRNREVLKYDIVAMYGIMFEERRTITDEKMFTKMEVDTGTQRFLQKEFYGKSVMQAIKSHFLIFPSTETTDMYGHKLFPKGIFFIYYYLSNNILSPLYSSFFWIILFFVVLGYSIIQFIRTKKPDYFILIILCALHLLSLIVVAIGNVNLQFRYEYVTGFMIYLVAALSPMLITYNISFKKPEK